MCRRPGLPAARVFDLPPTLLLLAALLSVGWILREPLLARWRRARIRRQPFPEHWRRILRARVPYFRTLPADLQLQLKKHMQVFLAEKPFIGCAGLVVTEEMRVVIAAQACLLLLNRRTDYYPALRQVLVYPGAFLVERSHTDAVGVQHGGHAALAGESWSQGQVIVSWQDVLEGAAQAHDGRNVVIHEFAHQLDQENGPANGAPHLPGRRRRERWAQVLQREFSGLRAALAAGAVTLLNPYAATDPAEFYAVASETFFEQPAAMAEQHPALYQVLSDYYRVDPLSW